MEKTFEELIEPLKLGGFEGWYSVEFISTGMVKILLQQVRESTITEAVNHCVSQDWVKTIDNLKKMPIDRIYNFEKSPTEKL